MILEHKSYKDKDFYEQILKYLVVIRELILRQTGQTKPITRALFYHGRQPLRLKKTLQEEDFKEFFQEIPLETRESMLSFKLRVIDTKDERIRRVVKNKSSKIWGVIKLFDEIWEIKEPDSEKVEEIVRDYFGEILRGKTRREREDLVIGIVEYLTDKAGIKREGMGEGKEEACRRGSLKKRRRYEI